MAQYENVKNSVCHIQWNEEMFANWNVSADVVANVTAGLQQLHDLPLCTSAPTEETTVLGTNWIAPAGIAASFLFLSLLTLAYWRHSSSVKSATPTAEV